MARLGIVIGVSENLSPLKSLAACKNDASIIVSVLRETKRFDDILILSGKADTQSKIVKTRIAEFVDKHKTSPVEEILFYFSGHGDFAGNEFYHLLSDYDASSRNQTSLANSELDTMIRGLSPGLFVKIIDACHSGTSYIKSEDAFDDYIKSTIGPVFKSIYFLYSSQSNEASWTAGKLSAFTKSILAPLVTQSSGNIRYRDLMSAASDYFEAHGKQTPLFVTQAGYTELFCIASPTMQAIVSPYIPAAIPAPLPASNSTPAKNNMTLLERIKEAEASHCTREEAIQVIDDIAKSLSKSSLSGELDELFSCSETGSIGEPDGAVEIGEWLSKHTERAFFATPTYRTERYKRRVPKDPLSWITRNDLSIIPQSPYAISLATSAARLLVPSAESTDDTKLIDATREVVSGYKNTAKLPFDLLVLRLEPKFRSLMPIECQIVPLVSASEIRLFWAFRHFRASDWDTVVAATESLQWNGADAKLKDKSEIANLTQRIASAFSSLTLKSLNSKWPETIVEKPSSTRVRTTSPGSN